MTRRHRRHWIGKAVAGLEEAQEQLDNARLLVDDAEAFDDEIEQRMLDIGDIVDKLNGLLARLDK